MKRVTFFLLLLIPFMWMSSCKSDQDNNNNGSDTTTVVKDNGVQTFFLVPSPEDVFGFADDQSLTFDKELLNPTENLSKYDNDIKLQEFNFGVYAADLAYSAAYSKNDETVQYLNTVRELSQDIGLSEVFNESLINRIEHISPEKDSLIAISNDTYFDIIRYLERNDKPSTLAIMAAGGWIECMYLVVNLTDFDANNKTIQQVADQKMIVSNLWKFLEQNQNTPSVKSLMEDFKNIVDIYNMLEVIVDETNAPKTDNNEKIIVVGGHSKIIITAEQYANLKKVIVETRNKLTLNNVSL
ncbi:MAG: hypothetical protein JXL97_10850 [Bacteroidales bacterium]|nr:hypothetical protein [Bacteroidales bacterium]